MEHICRSRQQQQASSLTAALPAAPAPAPAICTVATQWAVKEAILLFLKFSLKKRKEINFKISFIYLFLVFLQKNITGIEKVAIK